MISVNFFSQPPKMMEEFLRLAQSNTAKNLETCGILSGSLVSLLNLELQELPFQKKRR